MAQSFSTAFLSYTSRFDRYPADRSFIQAAREGIGKAGYYCRDMSLFGARAVPPPDTCVDEVVGADLFVGVFGPFFGTPLPDEPLRSYAMLEYDTAVEQGKDVLIFLLSPLFPWPLGEAREPDAQHEAQRQFLARIRESTAFSYEEFASADALERAVFQGVVEHRLRRDTRDLRDRLAAETATAALADPPRTGAEPISVAAGELFAEIAEILAGPDRWEAAHAVIDWAVARIGRVQTARVLARIFVDPEKDLDQRTTAAPLGEHVFSTMPDVLDFEEWLRREREGSTDAIDFSASIFQLLGTPRAPRGSGRSYPPDAVIVRLLSVLSANTGSGAGVAAARALFAFAGGVDDYSRDWEPSQSGEVTRRMMVDALRDPAFDPLGARYVLYVLSRCRDDSGLVDVPYELAYALDRGLPVAEHIMHRTETLRADEVAAVIPFLTAQHHEVRWAAALCLARHGHRRAEAGQLLAEMLCNRVDVRPATREELWGHLAWFDDPAVLGGIRSATRSGLNAAGRLTIGWLLRHGSHAPSQPLDPATPNRLVLTRDLAALWDAFSALPSAPAEASEDLRWADRPFARTYDDVGPETEALAQSRSHLIYLLHAPDHTGYPAWYFLRLNVVLQNLFRRVLRGSYQVDLESFGRVLESGYGEVVPDEVVAGMREKHGWTG